MPALPPPSTQRGTDMGVQITNEETVALYDSVTGVAFGPTFDSEEEAQHFLDWLEADGWPDPRRLTADRLETQHSTWFAATHDGNGMFIGDLQDDEDDEEDES